MRTHLTVVGCLLLSLLLSGCERSTPQSEAVHSANAEALPPSVEASPTLATSASMDVFAALPAGDLAVESPAVSAYLQRYFDAACAPDERLSFEQICQHYAAPMEDEDVPSPWPDVVLGIAAGQIASVVLAAPERTIDEGWRCEQATGIDGIRICYTAHTPDTDRQRWSAEWAAYFNAAG